MKTDREQHGLLGPVQSIRLEIARFLIKGSEWVEGPRVPLTTTGYDVEGKKVGESDHSFIGTVSDSDDYVTSYDTEGKATERSCYRDGILQSKELLACDNQGRIIEELFCGADSIPKYRRTFKYDMQGEPIERAYYKADGTLIHKYVHANEYDSVGNVIKTVISRLDARDNNSTYEPTLIMYKIITYY